MFSYVFRNVVMERCACQQMPNGMMGGSNGMVPMANQNAHMQGMVPIMQSPQLPPNMQGSQAAYLSDACSQFIAFDRPDLH